MGNFRLLNNDDRWKEAAKEAGKRDAEMRRDSKIPAENIFKPGEFGKWQMIVDKLHADLRKAVFIREKNLYTAVKQAIEAGYTSEDGQKLPNEVLDRVTRSIIRPLIVYHLIPTEMLATTDDEKLAAMKKGYVVSLADLVATNGRSGTCPWTVKGDWERIWYGYMYAAYSDCELRFVLEDRIDRRLLKQQKQGNLRGAIIAKLKADKKTSNLDLVLEEEDFNRLLEARKNQSTMAQMLTREMKHDAEDLKKYANISSELSKIDSKEQLNLITGSTVSDVHKSIDYRNGGGYFDKATANGLKAYFDTEDKVKLFRRYQDDPEWSKRSKYVGLECEFIESLTLDESFLGQWVDFIYTRANNEQTKVVRDCEEKLAILFSKEAAALKMPQFQEYLK